MVEKQQLTQSNTYINTHKKHPYMNLYALYGRKTTAYTIKYVHKYT